MLQLYKQSHRLVCLLIPTVSARLFLLADDHRQSKTGSQICDQGHFVMNTDDKIYNRNINFKLKISNSIKIVMRYLCTVIYLL